MHLNVSKLLLVTSAERISLNHISGSSVQSVHSTTVYTELRNVQDVTLSGRSRTNCMYFVVVRVIFVGHTHTNPRTRVTHI